MAKIDVTQVEGFDQLNKQLKRLDDKVKRTEIIKVFKKLTDPVEDAYKAELPVGKQSNTRFGKKYVAGTLHKAVTTKSVPARKSAGNPSVYVRPEKKGQYDAFYRFMVVKKGSMTSSEIRRGASRRGKNTVVDEARDRAFRRVGPSSERKAVDNTAKYVQKQINRLSNK